VFIEENPKGVLANIGPSQRMSRNRVAVVPDSRASTQGSRVAATLGFEPESRWDSRMSRPAVRERRPTVVRISSFYFASTWIILTHF